MRTIGILIGLLAAAASGCSQGDDVRYYRVTVGSVSALAGNNCPASLDVTTFTGVDNLGTISVYTGPSVSGATQYLLDGAVTGQLLVGTASGSAYTFTGTQSTEQKSEGASQPDITNTQGTTFAYALSGDGFTGTWTETYTCNSSAATGCPGNTDSSSYSCSQSAATVGVEITGLVGQDQISVTAPSPGNGVSSGSMSTSTSSSSTGGTSSSSSGGVGGGSGSSSSGGTCLTCPDLLTGKSGTACSGAAATFDNLRTCTCDACAACAGNWCTSVTATPTQACVTCMTGSCESDVTACSSSL